MVKTSEMSMELKQELAFTKEELAELEAAKKMPITFDCLLYTSPSPRD